MANGQAAAVLKRSGQSLNAGTSDGHLLKNFIARRGESAEAAFEALVRRHGPMVLRVCHKILGDRHSAEDAFQAVFLILARRAGSIRRPELLGNWLYGVALRTAWEAKMRDGRRREREAPSAEGVHGEVTADADRPDVTLICREEFEVLHEEVSRLPDRYRIPVVLCELEGLTYQEAARRLHCPVGTIGVRLSRAKERLRVRMIRRGVVPAAALMETLFGGEGAAALMPPVLVDATVRAATGFAASDAAALGLVSAPVVALSRAVLKTMALSRLKMATNLLMVVGVTATVGWLGVQRLEMAPASTVPHSTRPKGENPAPLNHGGSVALASLRTLAPAPEVAGAVIASDPRDGAAIVEVSRRRELKSETAVALPRVRQRIRDEQARGELLFAKEWVPNDPLSPGGDGLGPVYNETSCVACHGLGAPGGAGPETKNVVIVTAVSTNGRKIPKGLEQIHPGFHGTRSAVLHRFGTDSGYASWRTRFYESQRKKTSNSATKDDVDEDVDTRIRKLTEQTAPGRRLGKRAVSLNPRPGVTLGVSERNTPALFGAGRIDAIPPDVLVDLASRQPGDVRGRVSRNREGRIGRFGWKGQIASLHEFVRGACASELGLEVPGHSQAVSPLAPDKKAKGLDMTQPECDALVAYVRALPAPVAVDPTGPRGTKDMADGRRLFAEVGCATCHSPSLGSVRGIYSDLLLHDMGPALSDSGSSYGIEGPEIPEGPSSGEWRTPPLWGFRDSGPYLHDGRAETLEEAVALHGGQGTKAARQFFALPASQRAQIEAFLKSLVAPSSAAAPGVVLAAELEARIEPDAVREAEVFVRKQRERVAAREEQKRQEAERRKRAIEVVKRAQAQFPIAVSLEKMGRLAGALEFYRAIVREAPDTEEGRSAAARIAALDDEE